MGSNRQRGFTLVELLIVVVIVGILAGIVAFAIGPMSSNAQAAACSEEQATIDKAIDGFVAAHTGTDRAAVTMSDLTGGGSPILKSDPSSRFTVVGGTVTGIGKCAQSG